MRRRNHLRRRLRRLNRRMDRIWNERRRLTRHPTFHRYVITRDYYIEDLRRRIRFTRHPAIHRYTKAGNTDKVAKLLSTGSDVDKTDSYGRTPLMVAITAMVDISVVELLIKENANIYMRNGDGSNVLATVIDRSEMWLSSLKPKPFHMKILTLVFQKVKEDFIENRESTATKIERCNFYTALVPFMQDTEATKYYLEKSCKNRRLSNTNYFTILHVAVLREDIENVKFLLNYGIDVNVLDRRDRTPLYAHNTSTIDTDAKIEVLKYLLAHGARLNLAQDDGETPLEHLLKTGNRRTRIAVLESPSFREQYYPNGGTALYYLMQNKRICHTPKEEINVLLDNNFDLNLKNYQGISALTMAIRMLRRETAEYLIKYGAHVNWPELIKETPIIKCLKTELYHFDCDTDLYHREYYRRIVTMITQHQFDMDFKKLFEELNDGPGTKIDNQYYLHIVIANLVLSEFTQEYESTQIIGSVQYIRGLTRYYDNCVRRIVQLKNIRVHGKVSMYELLIATNDKMERYVCDSTLVSNMKNLFSENVIPISYYSLLTRQRVAKAIKWTEQRKHSGNILCRLTGLNKYGVNGDNYVVYKILNHLSRKDILNLYEDDSVPCENPKSPNVSKLLVNSMVKLIEKICL